MQLPYFFVRFAPALPAAASIAAAAPLTSLLFPPPSYVQLCVSIDSCQPDGFPFPSAPSVGPPSLLNERLDDVRWPVELIKERKRKRCCRAWLSPELCARVSCVCKGRLTWFRPSSSIYHHIISYIGGSDRERERERKLKMDQKSLDARVAEELLVWSCTGPSGPTIGESVWGGGKKQAPYLKIFGCFSPSFAHTHTGSFKHPAS